jgi:hypothetical protein
LGWVVYSLLKPCAGGGRERHTVNTSLTHCKEIYFENTGTPGAPKTPQNPSQGQDSGSPLIRVKPEWSATPLARCCHDWNTFPPQLSREGENLLPHFLLVA